MGKGVANGVLPAAGGGPATLRGSWLMTPWRAANAELKVELAAGSEADGSERDGGLIEGVALVS
jgi:hypothetical protein